MLYFIPSGWLHRVKIPEDVLTVHFIDVGQGDCTLVTAGGETMLIDTGEYTEFTKVCSYLESHGIKRLDRIIATHPHSDHMGAMPEILDRFKVGEVLMPPVPAELVPAELVPAELVPASWWFTAFLEKADEKNIKLTETYPGMIFDIGDAQCCITAPQRVYADAGLNNCSVCVRINHGASSFLICGDAEREEELDMAASGKVSGITVLRTGHHGSSSSSCEEFLSEVSPEIAVISCGAGNAYGHPSDQVIERIRKYTGRIFRTDLNGTIVFTSDGRELSAETERGAA